MNEIINGVYPTMITPFTRENQVDYQAAEAVADWYLKKGCDGIFAICQSSEIFYLTLMERVKLLQTVKRAAKKYKDRQPCIIASGHISDSLEAQADELNAFYEAGADGLVWISNRLDLKQEGDLVWIKNAEKLLNLLPTDIPLGIYECPAPYKRLLTPEILRWCLSTGRFRFIKDTCCDREMLYQRLELLKGTEIKLFNANSQTLLYSLRLGAAGFSGVMANFHPELYCKLCHDYTFKNADQLQAFLCLSAFCETLSYPVCAKYHMNLEGLSMQLDCRSRGKLDLTDYQKTILDQCYLLEKEAVRYFLS